MGTKLYVGNLPFATTTQDVQELFAEAGPVTSVDLITDRITGRSRGFAFVDMATPDAAQAALGKFNGFKMEGRALTVNEARPREVRFPPGFEPPQERRRLAERRGFGGGGRREDRAARH